jgi:hypothetical protein
MLLLSITLLQLQAILLGDQPWAIARFTELFNLTTSNNSSTSSSSSSSEAIQSLRLSVTSPFSRWKTVGVKGSGWDGLRAIAADCSNSGAVGLFEQLLAVLAADTQSIVVLGINREQRSVLYISLLSPIV